MYQLLDDPQVKAREMITVVEDETRGPLKVVGNPVKLSRCKESIYRSIPELGEHTEQILSDLLGLTYQQIKGLKDKNII
jgi:crotonobetainyl-CoA:carnitine CoA-transferase CaiB-like acyl-CoA transferase